MGECGAERDPAPQADHIDAFRVFVEEERKKAEKKEKDKDKDKDAKDKDKDKDKKPFVDKVLEKALEHLRGELKNVEAAPVVSEAGVG